MNLLGVDLDEDEHREEQQPALSSIRSLPQRGGPPALGGGVENPHGAPASRARGRLTEAGGAGRREERGRGGAGCAGSIQRLQERPAGGGRGGAGGRHGPRSGCLLSVLLIMQDCRRHDHF